MSECAVTKKSQSRKKLLATLRESLATATPVRIQRAVEPEEVLQGVVLELSEEWVLLADIRDGAYLDGYRVLRLTDLVQVEPETTFLSFLHQHNVWPPARPSTGFALSDPRTIITGAVSATGVVCVYREAKRPGKLLIGVPVQWRKKSLWLLPVTPQCHWEQLMDKVRLKDVTQVSFGGDYETAVLEVAGPMPPRTHPVPDPA